MFAKNKIFIYVTGLALTLMLVVFCILIMLKNKNFQEDYAFNLGMPSEDFYQDCCGCSLKKVLSFWKFKTYNLTNNENSDEQIFKQIQLSARNLVKTKDSIKGIHVKLNMNTKYEDVIRVLDICKTENVPIYMLKDYDIWMMVRSNSELKKLCPFNNNPN